MIHSIHVDWTFQDFATQLLKFDSNKKLKYRMMNFFVNSESSCAVQNSRSTAGNSYVTAVDPIVGML